MSFQEIMFCFAGIAFLHSAYFFGRYQGGLACLEIFCPGFTEKNVFGFRRRKK